MGFLYVAAASAAAPTSVGDYASLPSSADDGDWRTTADNGKAYRAKKAVGDPLVWLPPEVRARITGYATNASGEAYMIPSDALGDATTRGWVDASSVGGVCTKAADNPLQIDASGGGSARWRFTPTALAASILIAVHVEDLDGAAQGSCVAYLGNGSYWADLSLSTGAAGKVQWGSGTDPGQGLITLAMPEWVFVIFDAADADDAALITTPDQRRVCALDRGNYSVGSTVDYTLYCLNAKTTQLNEIHIFNLS